jgi:hypothetical protein
MQRIERMLGQRQQLTATTNSKDHQARAGACRGRENAERWFPSFLGLHHERLDAADPKKVKLQWQLLLHPLNPPHPLQALPF